MEVRALSNLPRLKPETLTPGTAAINPQALTIILLDELCGRLADLTELTTALTALTARMEHQMEKAPAEGKMRPFTDTITATQNNPKKWSVHHHILRDACSYAIVDNRGNNSVWVCLNDVRDGFKEVRQNESIKFDYAGHSQIERFFFYVAAGASTDVEITLEY
jgi:hypothetical protein